MNGRELASCAASSFFPVASPVKKSPCREQKKKEEEKAREKELNDLFKIAVSQPKVPVGMLRAVVF